jgi:hypothetical protein
VLFELTLYLVPGTFHLELVHGELDTKKVTIVRSDWPGNLYYLLDPLRQHFSLTG